MIPTDRFAALLIVAGLMIGFSGWFAPLMAAGIVLAGLVVALAASDWLRLLRLGTPEVSRTVDEKLSLGTENLVKLRIRNSSHGRLSGTLRDEFPEDFIAARKDAREDASEGFLHRSIFPRDAMLRGTKPPEALLGLSIAPRSESDLAYHVTPPHRGDFAFGDVYLRLRGPLGMLFRQSIRTSST
jgi:uncharacterized protein (DUF58 family)